jgi:hypothetical protein
VLQCSCSLRETLLEWGALPYLYSLTTLCAWRNTIVHARSRTNNQYLAQRKQQLKRHETTLLNSRPALIVSEISDTSDTSVIRGAEQH